MRFDDIQTWLSTIEASAGGTLTVASDDASFRRYYRLLTDSASFIVMDAPPEKEDCLPFVRVAGYLEAMNLNAPRILEADPEQGFLLLSDLGDRHYLHTLSDDPGQAQSLYADAMAALARLQALGTAFQDKLPPYDEALLVSELRLFSDWLCGTHLAIQFDEEMEAGWRACCDLLVQNALEQPQVFVHRDYHSRNLMHCSPQNPGILDFQDAVEGPLSYDLVSLLKDCYIRWPAERVRLWARTFYEQLPAELRAQYDADTFMRHFELMGVHRHLKAAGIFARLKHRDGKLRYMADIPRTLAYIVELAPRYSELAFLSTLIEEQVLPGVEAGL